MGRRGTDRLVARSRPREPDDARRPRHSDLWYRRLEPDDREGAPRGAPPPAGLANLAVHELRDLRGLQVVAHLAALLLGHPVPNVGTKDRNDAVVEHHRVLGVEIERPVDPFPGVPLLLFALIVKLQQRRTGIVV